MVTQGHVDAATGRQPPHRPRTGRGAAAQDPGDGFPPHSRCLILVWEVWCTPRLEDMGLLPRAGRGARALKGLGVV